MSISCSLKTTGSGYEGIEFVLSTSLLEFSKEPPRIVAGQREPSVAGGGLRRRRWHAYPAPPDRSETLLLQPQEGAPAGRPQLTARGELTATPGQKHKACAPALEGSPGEPISQLPGGLLPSIVLQSITTPCLTVPAPQPITLRFNEKKSDFRKKAV